MKTVLCAALASVGMATFLGAQQPDASPPSKKPAIEIRYCDMRSGRPPLKYLRFEITVRNLDKGPHWFILPSSIYERPPSLQKKAGINTIEVSSSPDRTVMVAEFLGTLRLQPESAGGFKALLLPAGAVVTVRDFGVSYWGDNPSQFPLRILIADGLTIGGVPVEKWVGRKLLSAHSADARELNIVASKSTPDNSELPIEMKQVDNVTVENALASRCEAR